MQYIGPISTLYTIYCMMVTSPAYTMQGLYTIYRTHQIKGMMSPSYIYNIPPPTFPGIWYICIYNYYIYNANFPAT